MSKFKELEQNPEGPQYVFKCNTCGHEFYTDVETGDGLILKYIEGVGTVQWLQCPNCGIEEDE